MEVHQPLDFSSNAGMSMSMSMLDRAGRVHRQSHTPSPPTMPPSPAGHSHGEQAKTAVSVLDLCVRRADRSSPMSSPGPSPRSPRSPGSPGSPLYHPYNNNNNNSSKSVNHNDVELQLQQHHQQLLLRAKMEMDHNSPPSYYSGENMDYQDTPVDVKPVIFPGQPSPSSSQGLIPGIGGLPMLSVLQHQVQHQVNLLPRSTSSAFGPAPRRRRTSSGLPDSPPGSSDERSSSAASPDLLIPNPTFPPPLAATPPLDLLVGVGVGSPAFPTNVPSLVPTSPTSATGQLTIPQQVKAAAAGRNGKPTRPFKAYPKDPLSLTAGVPGVSAAEAALGRASNEAYAEFRRRMLAQVQAATSPNSSSNSGSGSGSNAKAQRRPPSPTQSQQPADSCGAPPSPTNGAANPAGTIAGLPQDSADSNSSSSPESSSNPTPGSAGKDGKDAAYWERRRKNNEAAKRSRDARRAKEDEIAIRAAFLEQENLKLKYEVAALRSETAKLRCLLYSGAN